MDALSCSSCNLPKRHGPQFRPAGNQYHPGGVVFFQINPGYIGSTTKSEVCSKYKLIKNRDLVLRKLKMTKYLQSIQKTFLATPSAETWDRLCEDYFRVMRELWGWPPGKYAQTIEAHGATLDSIAIVNLAQCPVRDNNYSKSFLNKCWGERTSKLLNILNPGVIVAQGKTVFIHLKANLNLKRHTVLLGVHHASRASFEEKQRLLNKIRLQLNKA